MTRPHRAPRPATKPAASKGKTPASRPGRRGQLLTAGLAVLAVAGLFLAFRSGQSQQHAAGKAAYQVGQPAQGEAAPAFSLAASNGKTVSLGDYRGKNVLLFFQEGIGCQPCWDQIRDLETDHAKLAAAGIDDIVSVTTSPADLVAQKTRDDNLQTPVLSDGDLTVSRAYHANSYGMMGDSRDGHSFILVGPDGRIRWRADYGGAPNYTMYLPVDQMLRDMNTALRSLAPGPTGRG